MIIEFGGSGTSSQISPNHLLGTDSPWAGTLSLSRLIYGARVLADGGLSPIHRR